MEPEINNLKDDLFYFCALVEFTARKTLNRRSVIVNHLGIEGIKKQIYDAAVNHCLSFEQVSDEIIEWYNIPCGEFDTITSCEYKVPGFQDIGRLYSIMILDLLGSEEAISAVAEKTLSVFSSFISDAISNFSSDVYYQNPSYLEESYKAGYLLD